MGGLRLRDMRPGNEKLEDPSVALEGLKMIIHSIKGGWRHYRCAACGRESRSERGKGWRLAAALRKEGWFIEEAFEGLVLCPDCHDREEKCEPTPTKA